MADPHALEALTIGHSNHPIEHLIRLLRMHSVEVVADVRSHPHSRYSPQFNRPLLEKALRDAGVKYVYLGRELGGRPQDDSFYDEEGHVLYDRVAQSSDFQAGIDRLQIGLADYRVTLLCAEENPAACHRRLLVGRVLIGRGVAVRHIRGDGRLQSEDELTSESADADQLSLFGAEGEPSR